MRQCSLDQGGGCLFTVSSLEASPVGLNFYSLMLPSILLTAMAGGTVEFLTDITNDTVKRYISVSSLGASPGGLNYYSLMLPSVLLTAMTDVTIDFVIDVTYDTVKRLKRATSYPSYRHTNIQQHSRYYIAHWRMAEVHRVTVRTS
jgi:hypothetical protein